MSSSPPLNLIVRFSLPIPDLPLTISSPTTTTAQTLNTLIRPHLPPHHANSPLRLISAGALLPPKTPLATSLRLPAPPPSSSSSSSSSTFTTTTTANTSPSTSKLPAPPIYIHCAPTHASPLSPNALLAERSPSSLPSASPRSIPAPQPLGFDRLLSAGLSTTEIASLRSQFLARTQHTHTPDTMPSAAEMRVLEERWLDSAPGAQGRGDGEDGEDEGGLEDVVWGNMMGFFWAVGGGGWLVREEGVWSRRRQIAVLSGVLINITFGLLRLGG